jgi:hypothetical protein
LPEWVKRGLAAVRVTAPVPVDVAYIRFPQFDSFGFIGFNRVNHSVKNFKVLAVATFAALFPPDSAIRSAWFPWRFLTRWFTRRRFAGRRRWGWRDNVPYSTTDPAEEATARHPAPIYYCLTMNSEQTSYS